MLVRLPRCTGVVLPRCTGVVPPRCTGVAGLLVALLIGVIALPSAAADETSPRVGDCLAVAEDQWSQVWVESDPVSCSSSHTLEVTSVIPLASDADPGEVARAECGPLGVWNEVGVNRPVAGLVRDPLRIEPRYVAVRSPAPVLVCGAAVVSWDAQGVASVQPAVRSVEDMSRRTRASLRYCISGGARLASPSGPTFPGPTFPGPTIPCTEVPRWEVASWVVWTAFFDDYPGRTALRRQAERLCGSSSRYSLPTMQEWSEGLPRTWCSTKVRGN